MLKKETKYDKFFIIFCDKPLIINMVKEIFSLLVLFKVLFSPGSRSASGSVKSRHKSSSALS
jgi:hypothetical protein